MASPEGDGEWRLGCLTFCLIMMGLGLILIYASQMGGK